LLYRWIKLAAKPNSNQIALIGTCDTGYINLAIWNGDSNSWGNTGQCTAGSGNINTDAIEIQYVQTGTNAGDIVAVWGEGQYVKRRIWTGSSWNTTSTIADLGSGNTAGWLRLKANPNSNNMILVVGGLVSSNYTIYTQTYDGTNRSFGSLSSAHTSAGYGSFSYNRPFDVVWDMASGSNNAVLVYSNSTGLRYKTSSNGGSTWGSQQDITTSYQAYWVQVERVVSTIYLAIHDNADDLRTWTWASSTWTAKNTVTTDLEIDYSSTRAVEAFALSSSPLNAGEFEYRRPITILDAMTPALGCSDNLTNFPVLVSITDATLKSAANGGRVRHSSGYDIVFRAADGMASLDHEIEKYDPTTGELVAWVRIPTLVYNADTTIYMYYGNPEITAPTANPTGVWDTNYVGVWHLKETSGGSEAIKNSKTDSRHGTTTGHSPTLAATGKIGNGISCDPSSSDQYIQIANESDFRFTDSFTVSGWMQANSWDNGSDPIYQALVSKGWVLDYGGGNFGGWQLGRKGRDYDVNARFVNVDNNEDKKSETSAGTYNSGWHYLVGVYSKSGSDWTVRLYADGTAQTPDTSYGYDVNNSDGYALAIGATTRWSGKGWKGSIDEVRISNVARDACWTETSYNNQNAPGTFITLGSEEPSFVMTGYYLGNGVDNRAITGVGFQPDIVIIKSSSAVNPVCSTSSMGGDAKELGNTTNFVSGLIKSLDADGFTVGTDNRVNASSTNYYWVAFKAGAGELKVSSYVGDGVNPHSITGVGFQPDWVVVMSSNSGDVARHRSSSMSNTAYFETYANDATGILALQADGFQVDANSTVNTSGRTYHYFAFKNVSGKINVGYYTGNATDSRNITGVGFLPEYVIVRSGGASNFTAVARPASLSGDSTLLFTAGIPQTNNIQALQTDGFQVGTDTRVNASSTTYYWMAFGRKPLPTAVKLTSFTAKEYDGSVLLQWKTGYEVNNLGFHVYREQNGERVRLTPEPVAGSALIAGSRTALTAGYHYHWWDTSLSPQSSSTPSPTLPPRGGGIGWGAVKYWLKDIDLNGTHKMHGPVTPVISREPIPEKFRPELLSEIGMRLEEKYHHYWKVQDLKEKLAEKPKAKVKVEVKGNVIKPLLKVRRASTLSPQSSLLDTVRMQQYLAGRSAVKLLVKEEGWYRVTQPELVAAGLSAKANPWYLQLYADGKEQPIRVIGGKDGRFGPRDALEFYGVELDTPSADTRVYWLVEGSKPGKRIQEFKSYLGSLGSLSSSSFPYTVEKKDRTIYFSALKNGDEENFFGPIIYYQSRVHQLLEVRHLDLGASGDALFEVVLQGVMSGVHRVKVYLNNENEEVGEIVFEGQSRGLLRLPISQSELEEGENLVSLEAWGGEMDVSMVESIRLTYWHTYTAEANGLRLTAQGGNHLTVNGFSNPKIRVFDITEPNDPVEVIGKVESQKGGYAISFRVPGHEQRILLAIAEEKVKSPGKITPNQSSSWYQSKDGYDLVIVTHRDFFDTLQPLQKLRESQGLKVGLIDVEDLYDEFSFGNKSPKAIKDFLTLAKANWRKPPRFVLLVGDASFDPKNYLGKGDMDFVPTKLIDTAYMETASDDWFVDFNSDGLPEMAIGRLPVQTSDEASIVVSKIVGYEKSSKKNEALLVADINDGFNFESASEEVRALLPAYLMVRNIFRGDFGSDAEAKRELLNGINQGALLVNFIGHGSTEIWRGSILTSDDAEALTNSPRLPFFISMTCLNGFFQDVYTESLAEALLKAKSGGAIAVWTSSGMTEPGGQTVMDKELIRLLFGSNSITLGEATARAKASVSDQDIRRTWILFGDPSTRLK
jgi:hypothetical protein